MDTAVSIVMPMKKTMTKTLTLFSKEAVEKLRKDRFSGKLLVNWENGVINDFELSDGCFEM
jgi:hypothetical protein